MFYSHEVLTSRKYGVATIWLVATLGSKSSLKKISRTAILDVDVSKACETIVAPDAPMALRLQSNLLYGVTRVYSQQCTYVLNDAETARNSMRATLRVIDATSLDGAGGHKGRAQHLILQDDPNFLPELDLLTLDFVDTPSNFRDLRDSQYSTLSPQGSSQHASTIALHEEIGGLLIPPSSSSFAGGPLGGFRDLSILGDAGPGTRGPSSVFRQRELGEANLLQDDDLGLDMGDGNGVYNDDDAAIQHVAQENDATPLAGLLVGRASSASAYGQVGTDMIPASDRHGFVLISGGHDHDVTFSDATQPYHQQESTTTVESATAANRGHRSRKVIPMDAAQELSTKKISDWDANYLANMRSTIRQKLNSRLAGIAKKNADHLMLFAAEGPLDMFSGRKLYEAITGLKLGQTGEKRERDEADDAELGRRVRPRSEPPVDQQDVADVNNEDAFETTFAEDDVEQGRDQPTPLDDHRQSSIFPWHRSTGSRRPTSVFSGGANSGVAASPLFKYGQNPRASRLFSASPQVGSAGNRGQDRSGRGDRSDLPEHADNVDAPLLEFSNGFSDGDAFEPFRSASHIDEQAAEHSQWSRSALDSDSMSFLTFVEAGIDRIKHASNEEMEGSTKKIDFDTLLPPKNNNPVVAAQALLHALTLGTKDLLHVRQSEAFGPISLELI